MNAPTHGVGTRRAHQIHRGETVQREGETAVNHQDAEQQGGTACLDALQPEDRLCCFDRKGQKYRILLADDEGLVRCFATEVLQSFGHTVTACRDGDEALEHYRHSWQHIDLVVLDMVMPRMNGPETFAEMRRINPDVKVLFVSGNDITGRGQAMIDEGVFWFLHKPFNIHILAQQVAIVGSESALPPVGRRAAQEPRPW
ncbi:MAG: hypothetical protein A3K19_04710 [Lentisphaerae bacterium RIFOXYB12_FULL_65_16]|nr:MAG: hypothetical protein A3K18_11450 [Lentisphaerae bacterium RIFOXYA12_64_32]OGV84032.1 MAG: hypothetical protein A3K19_04710 [Lentisphaerae bacterium RIFOXYB12_FULL_65_16]